VPYFGVTAALKQSSHGQTSFVSGNWHSKSLVYQSTCNHQYRKFEFTFELFTLKFATSKMFTVFEKTQGLYSHL